MIFFLQKLYFYIFVKLKCIFSIWFHFTNDNKSLPDWRREKAKHYQVENNNDDVDDVDDDDDDDYLIWEMVLNKRCVGLFLLRALVEDGIVCLSRPMVTQGQGNHFNLQI